MGAKIDRAVGLVLLILGLYLLFRVRVDCRRVRRGFSVLRAAQAIPPAFDEDERAFRGRDSESLGARLG